MKRYELYDYSGFDWLGETPSHWKVLRMCYMFKPVSIKNTSGEINLSVYRDYGVIPTDSRDDNHNVISEDTSNYKLVEEGDFVMNKMKCWMGSLGLSDYRGIVSPSYTVMKPLQSNYLKYTHYLLRSKQYIPQYKRLSYGVREGQWDLRFEDFRELPCLIPPLSEQQQIVSFLDTKTSLIDSLIEKTQRKIELLKEKRTSLINEVVTKGLNPNVEMKDSGVEWIGEIPSHWKCIPIRHLGFFQNGVSKGSEFFGKGYPFMNYGDVYNNEVVPLNVDGKVDLNFEERSRYSVCRGDVFFTRTSETIDDIGISSVCLTTIDECSFSGFVIRYRFYNETHVPEYSRYHFQSHWKKVIIESKMNIVTRSSLSQQVLGGVPVLIPPFSEQQQIVSYLDEQTQLIDKTISIEEKRIDLLKEYRQSLISEVVTGKLKVTTDE